MAVQKIYQGRKMQKTNKTVLLDKSKFYLEKLCHDISERCVGSEGNRRATRFFKDIIGYLGWKNETQEFNVIDWKNGGADLKVGKRHLKVFLSPYSLGCSVRGLLKSASNIFELEKDDFHDSILFLYGDIAKEPIMPKSFVFYNPVKHKKIIALLEKKNPKAIICSTGKSAATAGGLYPFPLIEDGDFDIPSVYMTEEEGTKLFPYIGLEVDLNAQSERIPGVAYNVIGKRGENNFKRIVLTAHIDAKKGSPGAIDNATGVSILLLLADLLRDYVGNKQVEIVALNGEDYFSIPGQMHYIMANKNSFDSIILNINIDGVGYKVGKTAFSFFNLPEKLHQKAVGILKDYPGVTEGSPWLQGDHSIFLQNGCPAIAITSKWLLENMESQKITHTKKDHLDIINPNVLVETAEVINTLIRNS